MPQLDKVTFLSQFFWLCVFFIAFYITSLKYFLPKMARVLKYRKKRFNQSHQGVSNMREENEKVRESVERLIEGGLRSSRDAFKQNLQATNNWISQFTDSINQTQLKETNSNYLFSLGERCLSSNLSLQGSFNDFSSKIFVNVLISKLDAMHSSIGKYSKSSAARSLGKSRIKRR